MTVLGPDARLGHCVRVVRSRLGAHVISAAEAHADEDVLVVAREHLSDVLAFLRDDKDLGLALFFDLTCVDRGPQSEHEPRFLVVYRLKSARLGYRARVHVEVSEADATLPSVVELFPAADWYERELWDLYGIYPDGHPHLRRLLLYPGFSGHALLRDYPPTKAQPLVALRSSSPTANVAREAPAAGEGE